MMKEEEPMSQNQNSIKPISQKSHPAFKKVRVADDLIYKMENKTEGAKEEDQTVSSCLNGGSKADESGRERLKRHRVEVAGQVWIPDIWGQENFLHDWIDSSSFDAALGPKEIMSARASLVGEGRRSHSGRLSVENSVS